MANVTIKIRPGDITDTKADVCVSSVHRGKDMDTGPLASRMKARAGQSVQNELYKANGDRELQHGEIVITDPGALASKFKMLMFVCLYCWRTGNEQTLTKVVKQCLQLTTNAGFGTIAFPALGMGGQSYPPFQVAKSIITATIEFIQSNPDSPLRTVFIVLKDSDLNSTRTFLQTTVSILAGVQLGRGIDSSGSSVSLEGVSSFNGLENTKPRSLVHEVRRPTNQSETQTKVSTLMTGINNNAHISVQPQFSLSNWTFGVAGSITLDLKDYVPGVVKKLVGYLTN